MYLLDRKEVNRRRKSLQFRIARARFDLVKEGQQDNQKFIEHFMKELDIFDLQKKQSEEEPVIY